MKNKLNMLVTISLLHFAFGKWHVWFGWADIQQFLLISLNYNTFCLLQLSATPLAAQVAHTLINVHGLHWGHFFLLQPHSWLCKKRLSILDQNSLIREIHRAFIFIFIFCLFFFLPPVSLLYSFQRKQFWSSSLLFFNEHMNFY